MSDCIFCNRAGVLHRFLMAGRSKYLQQNIRLEVDALVGLGEALAVDPPGEVSMGTPHGHTLDPLAVAEGGMAEMRGFGTTSWRGGITSVSVATN